MASEQPHVIDWEHVGFVAVILAFLAWYLADASVASPTFSNLILIAPVGAVAIVLAILIGALEIFGHRAVARAIRLERVERTEHGPSRFRSGSIRSIMLLMGSFALFVSAIPYLGFDIGSFVFIAATLWLLGERRILFILVVALCVSAAISLAALTLVTVPVPLQIAPALWRAL
jgi:putative tricarboxylic transport membrane protein